MSMSFKDRRSAKERAKDIQDEVARGVLEVAAKGNGVMGESVTPRGIELMIDKWIEMEKRIEELEGEVEECQEAFNSYMES
jgi:hypothetical protein